VAFSLEVVILLSFFTVAPGRKFGDIAGLSSWTLRRPAEVLVISAFPLLARVIALLTITSSRSQSIMVRKVRRILNLLSSFLMLLRCCSICRLSG